MSKLQSMQFRKKGPLSIVNSVAVWSTEAELQFLGELSLQRTFNNKTDKIPRLYISSDNHTQSSLTSVNTILGNVGFL